MFRFMVTQALIDLNLGLFVIILISITIILAFIIALRQDILKGVLPFQQSAS